jgi:DNA-binding CsgD family transcriptional regulator
LIWYLGCLGRAQLAAGDLPAARRTFAELDGLIDQLPPGALPCGPALGQLGLAAAELGDETLAMRTYRRLRRYTGQHHWLLMDRALGALATALGDWSGASAHLDDAERAAERGGIAPELALVREGRAALCTRRGATGDHEVARGLLGDARARFAALGMVAAERRVAAQLDVLGPQAAARYPAGLSAREVEVLRLVVAGRTNREIADLLSLSERTVNNHVAHILAKTNTENRAAAAAFALRQGLA